MYGTIPRRVVKALARCCAKLRFLNPRRDLRLPQARAVRG
jgi:hypothetical protein